jgi:hypothetical protein
MGGEKFNPGTTEYIRWDYEGEDKTFNIEFSNDGGLTYTVIAANVPSAARNFCGQFLLIGFQMQKLELVQEVKLTFLHNPFRLCRNQKILVIVAEAAVEHLIKWIGMQLQVLNTKC